MTEYVYKSLTGHPVNVENYVITPSPGLYSKYQIEALDRLLGSTLTRYDDGVITNTDDRLPVSGIKGATGVVTGILVDTTPVSYTRVLKNFTGSNILSGGTVNTKTLLMQVPIPNGALADAKAGIRMSGYFGCTLNTNSKSFGIDIGTSFGAGTSLWTKTLSSGTAGAQSFLLDIQQDPTNAAQILIGYSAGVTLEGSGGAVNTSTYTTAVAVNPATNGLNLYLWGNVITANTDQVTLARCKIDLVTAES